MDKQTNRQGIEVRSFGNGAKPQVQQGSRLIQVFAERAQARHNARTPEQIAEIQKRWDERRELMKAYHAHPADEWEHTAIYPKAGGYVVTSKERIKEGKRNSRERDIFDKELAMCHTCAVHGHRVEYLSSANREKGKTFDILFDGRPADLKSFTGTGAMIRQLKHALREQGAEVAVVELVGDVDNKLYDKLLEARRKIDGVIYFYKSEAPEALTELKK